MMLKLSFLNRFLLLMSLLVVGILKGYSQNDFDKPIMSSVIASPSYVDVSSGGVTVTFSVQVSDTSTITSSVSGRGGVSFPL